MSPSAQPFSTQPVPAPRISPAIPNTPTCHLVTRFGSMLLGVMTLAWACGLTPLSAQEKPLPAKAKKAPPPEEITLQTKPYGNFLPINLSCTWFGGIHEKATVPVILLHEWNSDRKALLPLAQKIQKELGCAVLVPDLRGHGESTEQVGNSKRLRAEDFTKHDIPFVTEDLEACKRFLKERHNAGELNLDLLTIIACRETSALAAAWATADWQWPPYNGVKQGQDVKLLIFLSPVRKFESVNLGAMIKTPLFSEPKLAGLTTVFFWDTSDPESERDAAAMEGVLVKGLGSSPDSTAADRWERTRYALKVVKNGGVGERLLTGSKADLVSDEIVEFIQQKLASRADQYPWIDRREK